MTVVGKDGPKVIEADYYVAALPVERLQNLLTNAIRAADPQLARIDRLTTRWNHLPWRRSGSPMPCSGGWAAAARRSHRCA
ncbi:MAG: hypothetical protein QOI25_4670 [Mycobacterium sp.]|nr:hypothetical protein [Mycobacterium sp.]